MADLESSHSSRHALPDEVDPERRETHGGSGGQGFDDPDSSGDDAMADVMEVQADVAGDYGEDMMLAEHAGEEQGGGKRVKVYELRDQAWVDRGTGHCKGVYDDHNDVALLIVEAEETPPEARHAEGAEGPGGFLKDDLLLNTRVSKEEKYDRQQGTLIVWTDHATQQDIALSFQDVEGCDDIWQFIVEVQKHLSNQFGDDQKMTMASSSSPLATSPLLGSSTPQLGGMPRDEWQQPTLANIKDHEMWLRMQAKSAAGRERAVEHIIGEHYIKQLIGVLNQAEDLESINDLHALCSLMQTILMFNDNGIFEYILQDDVFMGVLGMLEYDPEFPTLKASYRAFFRQYSKFRQVVEIKDESIRNKIHQTSRLLYLKDVVLARLLDDPTFGILNSFVFFNQVDITTYIQSDEQLLHDLFVDFGNDNDSGNEAKKRDLVVFLHQLMVTGKGLQLANRLALYRTLLDRGLPFACEWAFRQREAVILHAGAEILTLAVEHDVNAVRMHVLREEELSRRTLVLEVITLLQSTRDQGLMQQMIESLKTLLEGGQESEQFARVKEVSVGDTFTQYFYDYCASQLFAPVSALPELKDLTGAPDLTAEQAPLIGMLVDLLSYCIQMHAHKSQYFVLSNPLAQKVCSLVYASDKTLRHFSLRFIKSCLMTNNHFIHRNFAKNGVTKAILDLVDRETCRDTMLSSACLDTLELIRKENMKPIITDMFDKYEPIMSRLADRPFVRAYAIGLRVRWEQYKEPPPPPPAQVVEQERTRSAAEEEEAWFIQSDDEDADADNSGSPQVPSKRKRLLQAGPSSKRQLSSKVGGLGLDYDDASDSEGSADESPKQQPRANGHEEDGLSDVMLKARAKREREEKENEDDGAFANLLAGKKPPGEGSESSKPPPAVDSTPTPDAEGDGQEKKIKLSLGTMGKKLGGQ